MQLDSYQAQEYSMMTSGRDSASGALSSLKADYQSASAELACAAMDLQSVGDNPFDPNGQSVQSSAQNVSRKDQIIMAHDSAVAPQYQQDYQDWSMKITDFTNSGSYANIGAQLAQSVVSSKSSAGFNLQANYNPSVSASLSTSASLASLTSNQRTSMLNSYANSGHLRYD